VSPEPFDDSPEPVALRRVETVEEYRAVEEVQREAWGFTTDAPVPTPILRAINDNGGLLLGAFSGPKMIGFALGFLAREEEKLFHYSHMTAVRPSRQHRHVGLALKARQREEVLGEGLDEVRWTYDPLQSKNAGFNVRRLGGVPDRYLPRYYGTMADAINEGLDTDRVRLVWRLRDPKVEERLHGHVPSPADDLARLERSESLIETALGPSGLRRPVAVRTPTTANVCLEIPVDLSSVRARDLGGTRRWREATREAFTRAFAEGYAVDDFAVVSVGNERRSFYFLDRRT
jgi:predicted GNAT superfamily acetyltransferase